MRVLAGTSGFSYPGWRGHFYPEKLSADEMLAHYAGELPTVEINNTFYRMPKTSVVEGWVAQASPGFSFVLKASRRITHTAKLGNVDETLAYLWKAVDALGDHAGPVLFQLPPTFRKNAERLRSFCAKLPDRYRAVLEFRNPSWDDDEVRAILSEHDVATCLATDDEHPPEACDETADFGYLRLRGTAYSDAHLDKWADWLRARSWKETYVFFKHEDEGLAPRWARELLARC